MSKMLFFTFFYSEIKKCYDSDTAMNESLHKKSIKHYNEYLSLGGMPSVINNYLSVDKDFSKVDLGLMKAIIESYFDDMEKYILINSESLKIRKMYASIANQVGSTSRKFVFNKIDKNAKKRDYDTCIDWLLASNLVLKSDLVNSPVIPLKSFVEPGIFKMFLSDVGILNSLLDIKFIDILEDNLSLYKGALAENFVATELTCKTHKLHYYSKNDELEVDFLLYTCDGIIPVEVKAGINTKSKSLEKYINKYNPKYAIRISLKNFGMVNNIKLIPLYATFLIENE